MQHLDEHTIELYVLGSDLVKNRIQEIELHLRECHGCRMLAEQMESFYENAEKELAINEFATSEPSKAIIKRRNELDFANGTYTFPVQPVEKRYLAKFLYFVYRHPVTATLGGFVLVIALAGMLNYAFYSKNAEDTNPVDYRYNRQENVLEILNDSGKVIFRELSNDIDKIRDIEKEHKVNYVQIKDLDNDGKNEVITTLSLNSDKNKNLRSLRIIYNGDKKTTILKTFDNENFNYQNKYYSPYFKADAILVDNFLNRGQKEILVFANNQTYSPFFVALLDKNGEELGKYWHYGHLLSMNLMDVNNDGSKELILCGMNDTQDSSGNIFPVVIVLDPAKIIGNLKSSTCPGYSWDYSKAELFYIRFPVTDMDSVSNTIPSIKFMMDEGNGNLYFYQVSFLENKIIFDFRFHFSNNIRIIEVKTSQRVEKFRADLVKKGKVVGLLDNNYLKKLKENVQYWDGKKWQKEWTMVKHEDF